MTKYFITCCGQDREHFFGEIINEEMILNDAGRMIEVEWMNLPDRFIHNRLHEFIIMPNHFHGIVEIVGATLVVAQDPEKFPAVDSFQIIERGQAQGIAPTDRQTIDPMKLPKVGDIFPSSNL